MSISGNQIIAPVDVSDVQKVLGVTANDVGSLCRNGKINKWSRYKPVKYQGVAATGYLTSGITLSYISDTPENIALAEPGVYEWNYQIPTGGASSPYRLTDFSGYNHACKSPITIDSPGETIYGDNGGAVHVETRGYDLPDSNLKLSDVFSYSQYASYRFCVAIADVNGTDDQAVKVYYVSEYTWAEWQGKDMEVEVGISRLADWGLTHRKKYKWCLFLADIDVDNYATVESKGISASDFEAAVGTAIALEPEAGCNQGEFTYVTSKFDDLPRPTWVYFGILWERLNMTVNDPANGYVAVDIYSCNPNQIKLTSYTAAQILTGELRAEISITGYHYPWGMVKKIDNAQVDAVNPDETYSGTYDYTGWVKVQTAWPDLKNQIDTTNPSKIIEEDLADLIAEAYSSNQLGFSDEYGCNCPMFFIRDSYPKEVGLRILYRAGSGGVESTLITASGQITASGNEYIIDNN